MYWHKRAWSLKRRTPRGKMVVEDDVLALESLVPSIYEQVFSKIPDALRFSRTSLLILTRDTQDRSIFNIKILQCSEIPLNVPTSHYSHTPTYSTHLRILACTSHYSHAPTCTTHLRILACSSLPGTVSSTCI
jgi:hypothetical protein